MSGVGVIRYGSGSVPRRQPAPPRAASEPEHVEEVWDAELVADTPAPGWLAVPARSTYLRAGYRLAPPRIDLLA